MWKINGSGYWKPRQGEWLAQVIEFNQANRTGARLMLRADEACFGKDKHQSSIWPASRIDVAILILVTYLHFWRSSI
jgi:hypothetical protein